MVSALLTLMVGAGLFGPAPAAPSWEPDLARLVRREKAVSLAVLKRPSSRRQKTADGRAETTLAVLSVAKGTVPPPAKGMAYVAPVLPPRSPRASPSSQRDPPAATPID